MSQIFHTFIYNPIYNLLVGVIDILPNSSVAIAVIIVTLIVRLILFPLSKGAVRTQLKLKEVTPQIDSIRERFKNDKEKQAMELLKVYRENKINPFASILLLFIQIPFILALYWIFFKGGLPVIDPSLLYSFTPVPDPALINMHFLGFFDIGKPQIILGFVAAVTQFIQTQLAVPPHKSSGKEGFQEDIAKSLNIQIRFVMPVIIFFVSLSVSGAVAIYWITGNIFMIFQEIYMKKRVKNQTTTLASTK